MATDIRHLIRLIKGGGKGTVQARDDRIDKYRMVWDVTACFTNSVRQILSVSEKVNAALGCSRCLRKAAQCARDGFQLSDWISCRRLSGVRCRRQGPCL